jgi:hypothetical protein
MPFRYSYSMLRFVGNIVFPRPLRGFVLDTLFGPEDPYFDPVPRTRRPRTPGYVGGSSTPSTAASFPTNSPTVDD